MDFIASIDSIKPNILIGATGIGLGTIISNATTIPDELFLVASWTLANLVSAVAEKVYELGISKSNKPANLRPPDSAPGFQLITTLMSQT